MDGLRVGLIGYGLAGAVFHAPPDCCHPGLELAMVVTRDPARRAALHARHPSAQAVREVGELWAHADDLDLVVIATPNEAHVLSRRPPSTTACPSSSTSRWRSPQRTGSASSRLPRCATFR
jgi:hypothetical protein